MPILYIVKLLKTSYKEKLKLINKFRGKYMIQNGTKIRTTSHFKKLCNPEDNGLKKEG